MPPKTERTPGGRSTVFPRPVFLRRGDPLPAALVPKKPKPQETTVELTSHLRPASRYRQMDEEEEAVTEEQPNEREEAYIRYWRERGRSEEEARAEFKKYDAGAESPSERMRAARERYSADEAVAADREAKRWREDPDLKRVPQVFREAWGRRGMTLEEQKREARHIPESRLLPEEGAK